MARCGKDTPDRGGPSGDSIGMALLLSVRVRSLVLSHIPGKLGPVRFTHADHATRYRRPDGAIDLRTVLFHDQCRGCSLKIPAETLNLATCKVCHPKGLSPDAIHGRYDAKP